MSGKRRLRLRRPRGRQEQLAAVLVAAAVATMVVKEAATAWEVVLRGWPLAAALGAAGATALGWRQLRSVRQQRAQAQLLARLQIPLTRIDAMGDAEFEYALRDLLIREGWSARKVGQKGDQSADVLGRHVQWGRIVVQAKHTRVGGKVGSAVMYQVKGTAGPVHRADISVVVTNGGITRDAKAWGDQHQVHWVDRDRLRQWAEEGVPLHTLLRLPARAPRRSAGRRAA
ncbi:restriction endonuclease [Streptomyces violens]|uniref:restriction endonuclease n=1 Tax=Streptomyces violens TaxID=66377 RepID=UPI0004C04016|nr:restriction endonuclease [Streptomyces violens]